MAIIPVIAEILDVLLNNPLMAWLVLITGFALDSWLSSFASFQGVVGWVATEAGKFLLNNSSFYVTSFQILVLIVIVPLCAMALRHSARVNRTR